MRTQIAQQQELEALFLCEMSSLVIQMTTSDVCGPSKTELSQCKLIPLNRPSIYTPLTIDVLFQFSIAIVLWGHQQPIQRF